MANCKRFQNGRRVHWALEGVRIVGWLVALMMAISRRFECP